MNGRLIGGTAAAEANQPAQIGRADPLPSLPEGDLFTQICQPDIGFFHRAHFGIQRM